MKPKMLIPNWSLITPFGYNLWSPKGVAYKYLGGRGGSWVSLKLKLSVV